MADAEDEDDQRIVLDGLEHSSSGLSVELAKCFRRGGDVGDPVCHGSDAELVGEILVGYALGLLPCSGCGADISLIFERLDCTVIELRRHEHGAAADTAGGDLDRFALRHGDEIGLAGPEVGERYRSHAVSVQLVQDVRDWSLPRG